MRETPPSASVKAGPGLERVAVIDMGSNSFRLVVYSFQRGHHWKLSDEIREPVRVSAGMGQEAVLKREPMERALHTAAVFDSYCRAAGVSEAIAVATSAIRDAANGGELLRRIRERTGLAPRVISGRDEAWYGYLAIANSTTIEDGFGIELGGGSAQLMEIQGRRLARADSFPLGAVRVSEAFLPGAGKASPKAVRALRKHVTRTIRQGGWLGSPQGGRVAAIGGSVRNLAAAAQKRLGHPATDVGGFRLDAPVLDELVEELASRPVARRGALPGIKPDRGDVILGAAVVLASVMEAGGIDMVEVSEAGLREGVFFERLLAPARPPLFEDVRRDSVRNLANQFDFDSAHAGHVAHLSLEMYDGLARAGLLTPEPAERELLWAACMLHDIGVAIDYDDHHRHSHYLILNAGLPGFSPRELVLIALIARYHRKGDPDASELGPLQVKGDERRLRLLSGIIRLAEQLERSRDGAVRTVRMAPRDGSLELAAEAVGDASVALWSARRNSDLLAEAVGRPVEIARLAPRGTRAQGR